MEHGELQLGDDPFVTGTLTLDGPLSESGTISLDGPAYESGSFSGIYRAGQIEVDLPDTHDRDE